jgi:hypothetical protein
MLDTPVGQTTLAVLRTSANVAHQCCEGDCCWRKDLKPA